MKTPDFSKINVAVIGDIILDEYYDCIVNRISPEAPIPIARTDKTKHSYSLGGATNVALNCKKLGANVDLYGIIGNDQEGERIINLLETNEIEKFLIRQSDIHTITKIRYRSGAYQLLRVDFENGGQPYAQVTMKAIVNLLKSYDNNSDKYDVVILSDYAKGTLDQEFCQCIINVCKSKDIPVFVDPKTPNWYMYKGASCITPNLNEFNSAAGSPKDSIENRAKRLMSHYNLDSILVTMGEDGLFYIDYIQQFYTKAETQEVFDVSGAGDTVISTFALCNSVADYSQSINAHIANKAASVVIRQKGTQAITYKELVMELQKDSI